MTTNGRCVCGAVRYRVKGASRDVLVCHCSLCSRMNTHVGAYSACATSDLVVEEAGALTWYSATPRAKRGFCNVCGSALFWSPTARNYIAIAVGSLDSTAGLSIVGHICVAQKKDYYEICDGLPQRPD